MSPSNNASPDASVSSKSENLVTYRLTETAQVCVISLNRPAALNAVSRQLAVELFSALSCADNDTNVRVAILTGSGRSFSAGADIKELQHLTAEAAIKEDWLASWNREMCAFRKPLIAAINGLAFGGGLELAMMCDILHCCKSASFALPEITLGTLPGAGGTQRLVDAIGKSRAFEMILSGDQIDSDQALAYGLVSRVCQDDVLLSETIQFAQKLAAMSSPALMLAKKAINVTQRTIHAGLLHEKSLYHSSFGTDAFRAGVSAFLEKRKPSFQQ